MKNSTAWIVVIAFILVYSDSLAQSNTPWSTTGNIGIGTTSPQTNLHLRSTDAYSPQLTLENVGGAGAGYLIFRKTKPSQGQFVPGDGLGTILSTAFANGAFQQSSYLTFLVDAPTVGSNVFSALAFVSGNADGSTSEKFRLSSSGNVGIGTSNPTQKLSVNGTVRAKEVIVETTGWSDYVLAKDYILTPLSEVEQQIEREGHLSGIPSTQDVAESGVSVGEMQARLLAKVEELTLHLIAQDKRLSDATSRISNLEAENAELRAEK